MALVLLGILVPLKTLADPKLTADSFPRFSSVRISWFSTEEIENTSDLSFDSSEVSFDSSEVSFDSSEEIPITSLDIFYFPANYSEILPEESYQAPNASISRAEISHETTISLDISFIFALGRIFRFLH